MDDTIAAWNVGAHHTAFDGTTAPALRHQHKAPVVAAHKLQLIAVARCHALRRCPGLNLGPGMLPIDNVGANHGRSDKGIHAAVRRPLAKDVIAEVYWNLADGLVGWR